MRCISGSFLVLHSTITAIRTKEEFSFTRKAGLWSGPQKPIATTLDSVMRSRLATLTATVIRMLSLERRAMILTPTLIMGTIPALYSSGMAPPLGWVLTEPQPTQIGSIMAMTKIWHGLVVRSQLETSMVTVILI